MGEEGSVQSRKKIRIRNLLQHIGASTVGSATSGNISIVFTSRPDLCKFYRAEKECQDSPSSFLSSFHSPRAACLTSPPPTIAEIGS